MKNQGSDRFQRFPNLLALPKTAHIVPSRITVTVDMLNTNLNPFGVFLLLCGWVGHVGGVTPIATVNKTVEMRS